MKCLCGGKSKVMETRHQVQQIIRRRRCLDCSKDFTTLEQIFEVDARPAGVPTAARKEKRRKILQSIQKPFGMTSRAKLEEMREQKALSKT